MRTRIAVVLGLIPLLFWSPGCDKASPVAPVGAQLVITANPAQIDPDGSSNITVFARKEDGSPVNPGTEIIFSTTLGTIDSPVRTDELGVAGSVLRGDGRVGTATVTALSGAADLVTVDVQIGSFVASITLQATPSVVGDLGAEIELIAIVRDDNGQLLEGAAVNFLTALGVLASRGAAVFTDPGGAARDTLTVTPEDLVGVPEEQATFAVTAQAAGADGLLIEATFDIAIRRLAPVASFDGVDIGGCSVAFTSTSTGQEPLTHEWDFDLDGIIDSTAENPTADFRELLGVSFFDTDEDTTSCPDDPELPATGTKTDATVSVSVRLTVTNELGSDTIVDSTTVNPNN